MIGRCHERSTNPCSAPWILVAAPRNEGGTHALILKRDPELQAADQQLPLINHLRRQVPM